MTSRNGLDRAITRGLRELAAMQRRDGSFPALSSPDLLRFTDSHPELAVFPTALIARSLGLIFPEGATLHPEDHRRARSIIKSAGAYLLSQKSAKWSWNYWERDALEAKRMPYPDDLDDTFVALAGIHGMDAGAIPGAALASIVQLMFGTEVAPGGPYRTWLVASSLPKVWQDTDLAVNANIGAFWHAKEVSLPGLTAFIEERIRRDNYSSPYYPAPYPVLYVLSLWYRGPGAARIVRYLCARQREGRWRTPAATALAITALLNFGVAPARLRRAVLWLTKAMHSGRVRAEALYTDPVQQGVQHYGGSPALSTALAVEALVRYRLALGKEAGLRIRAQEEKTRAAVLVRAKRRLLKLPLPLRRAAASQVAAMAAKDNDGGITLLAPRFAGALKKRGVSAEVPAALGAANLLGWAGYDLLDDIWDGDVSEKALPVADALVRETLRMYEEVIETPLEKKLFYGLMGRMSEAARFELAECRAEIRAGRVSICVLPRFKTYATLADRSLPHAVGPLLLLARAGHPPGSKAHRALLSFFRSLLIARQLSDDAHDWEEDLFRGHISPVVAAVLRASGRRTVGEKSRIGLRSLFWKKVIFKVAGDIMRELSRAERSLRDLRELCDTTMLGALLQPLSRAAWKAVKEAEQAQDFMKTYKS